MDDLTIPNKLNDYGEKAVQDLIGKPAMRMLAEINGAKTVIMTLTADGRLIWSDALSPDEASATAAELLATQYSELHRKQEAEIAYLCKELANIGARAEAANAEIAVLREQQKEAAKAAYFEIERLKAELRRADELSSQLAQSVLARSVK